MKKYISIDGRVTEYVTIRKSIKNVYIRVKPDGIIYVSLPQRISHSEAVGILENKRDFLRKAIAAVSERKTDLKGFMQNRSIYLFGERIPISFEKSMKNQIKRDSGGIMVYLKNMTDEEAKKQFCKYASDDLLTVSDNICKRLYPLFSSYCGEYPKIKIRNMKSQWEAAIMQKA